MERHCNYRLILIFFALFFSIVASASPVGTTYQARIIKPDGLPLESASVNFKFTVLDPAAVCILYSETFSAISMTNSSGVISFTLGSGVKSYPTSSTTFAQVFNNSNPALSCDVGGPVSYSPLSNDIRKIVMQFNDGSGWQTLPAMAINAVPYAIYSSDSLQLGGVSATEYVRTSTIPTCTASEAIRYNGTSFSCVSVASGGGASATITSSDVTTALGYTPANVTTVGTSFTTVGTSFTTVTSTLNSLGSSITAVSTSVASLSSSLTALTSTVATHAASLAAITSSQWTASGTDIYFSTGRVGVGTSSPTENLHVAGTNHTYLSLDSPLTRESQIKFKQNGVGKWHFGMNISTDRLDFWDVSNTTVRMTVTSSGAVGIGTVTPVATLDVSGGVRIGMHSSSCSLGLAGTLRYTSGNVEYCNGTTWQAFGTGSGVTSSSVITALGYTPADATSLTALTSTVAASITANTNLISTISTSVTALSTSYTSLAASMAAMSGAASGPQWAVNGSNISYSVGNVGVSTSSPAAPFAVGDSLTTPSLTLGDITSAAAAEFNVMQTLTTGAKSAVTINSVASTTANSTAIDAGLVIDQRIAASQTADIGSRVGSLIFNTNPSAANANQLIGQINWIENSGGGTAAALVGVQNAVQNVSGTAGIAVGSMDQTINYATMTQAIGTYGVAQNTGDGTLVRLEGGTFSAYNAGKSATEVRGITVIGQNMASATGVFGIHSQIYNSAPAQSTVGSIYGIYSHITDSGAASVTATYGLYLDKTLTTPIANNFGIYQRDGDSKNYFAAKTGIGTQTPITTLDVSGGIRISTETAACSVSYAGTLRYVAGNVEYCNGTAWGAFSTGGVTSSSIAAALSYTPANSATVTTSLNTISTSFTTVSTSLTTLSASYTSLADLFPAGSVVLMDNCPGVWSNVGSASVAGPGAVTCNGGICNLCQTATAAMVPASTHMLFESCPTGWSYRGKATGPNSVGYAVGAATVDFVTCQSPATASFMPKGSRLLMQTCPAAWTDLGDTAAGPTLATCGGPSCKVCEVPGGVTNPKVLYGGNATSATLSGSDVYVLGGKGGATSGNGGAVHIQAGQTPSTSAYSNVSLQASGGNVGVATTSPSYNLDVAGSALLRGGASHTVAAPTYGGTFFSFDGATNTAGLWAVNPSSSQFAFYTKVDGTDAGTERMRIDNNGRIGIGTSSPATKLHVNGDITADKIIDNSAGNALYLQTGSTTPGPGSLYITDNEGDPIFEAAPIGSRTNFSWLRLDGGTDTVRPHIGSFSNAGNPGLSLGPQTYESLVINSSGYVGIGTSSPAARLDISGGGGSVMRVVASENANATPNVDGDFLTRLMPQNATTEGGHLELKGAANYSDWVMDTTSGELRFFEPMQSRTSVKTRSGILFMVNSSVNSTPASIDALKIANSGYVGVGTVTPTTPLHVANTATTTSAVATLETTGVNGRPYMKFRGDSTDLGYVGYGSTGQPNLIMMNYVSGPTYLGTNSVIRMSITSSGSVGIGTQTPNNLLDVEGTAQVNYLRVDASDGVQEGGEIQLIGAGAYGNIQVDNFQGNFRVHTLAAGKKFNLLGGTISIEGTGGKNYFASNVGIGNSNPLAELDITGDGRATGTFATWSDVRTKKNIKVIPDSLGKILRLRGVGFDWRTDEFPEKKFKTTPDIGVIAQEVEKVFPEVVKTASDGYKSVGYAQLVAPLIEAVKELYYKITGVERKVDRTVAEVDALKAENAELKQRLERLEKMMLESQKSK